MPAHYKGKAIINEKSVKPRVYRVWIPALSHNSSAKRIFLHICFVFSALFALPFIGRVDVVWGANPNLFSFLPSSIYGGVKRVPIIRNVDDLWPEVFYELGYVKSKFAKKLLDFFAWASYTFPVAITPISYGYKRSIIGKYGICPDKVHVIEVGVENVMALDNNHNQSKHQFTVMYSGGLGLGYDFKIVLEAARLLVTNPYIVFVIRGNGELVSELRKNAFGLKNVIISDDFVSKQELVSMLSSADVFMFPIANIAFVDLGLPTKIFEYQACGKPIICISEGESARYIKSTGSGLVVKHGDVLSFVNAINLLFSDTHLAAELGCAGHDYVSKNLTSTSIGAHMYNLFESVCK